MKMKMQIEFGIRNLETILLPAFITSREIYKLQETKDGKEKSKKVGRRSAKRNEKLETHKLRIIN